jgi:hypothetical protein
MQWLPLLQWTNHGLTTVPVVKHNLHTGVTAESSTTLSEFSMKIYFSQIFQSYGAINCPTWVFITNLARPATVSFFFFVCFVYLFILSVLIYTFTYMHNNNISNFYTLIITMRWGFVNAGRKLCSVHQ